MIIFLLSQIPFCVDSKIVYSNNVEILRQKPILKLYNMILYKHSDKVIILYCCSDNSTYTYFFSLQMDAFFIC
jgi:hypothetical protein